MAYRTTVGKYAFIILVCGMAPLLFLHGCGHFNAGPAFEEADDLFRRGNYIASLATYQRILSEDPSAGDRILFEMGMIHTHPRNEQKDYRQALDCFEKVIRQFPASPYRKDSEMMIFSIATVFAKDKTIADQQALIAAQQTKIEVLQQEAARRNDEWGAQVLELQKNIRELEQRHFHFVLKNGSADRIVVEKKERRLTLFLNDQVLKTYRIALGGNPDGPKERQGDNKTPEGTYFIAGRNKNSRYHLSLQISYPNEKDKKRARELGVSPGGDIMIHGIKNGLGWVGERHAGTDWTKGCIAVTDEEIEEIARLVPNGTRVEIRP